MFLHVLMYFLDFHSSHLIYMNYKRLTNYSLSLFFWMVTLTNYLTWLRKTLIKPSAIISWHNHHVIQAKRWYNYVQKSVDYSISWLDFNIAFMNEENSRIPQSTPGKVQTSRNQVQSSVAESLLITKILSLFRSAAEWLLHGAGTVPNTVGLSLPSANATNKSTVLTLNQNLISAMKSDSEFHHLPVDWSKTLTPRDKASSSDPPPITYCTESWEPVGNMIFIVFLWTRRTRVSIHQNSLTIFLPSIVAVWPPLDSKSTPTGNKNSSNPSAEDSCTSPWLQNQQKLRFNNPRNQKLKFSKLEKEISKYVATTWIWSTITQWQARK